jgi:dolichol-phosphate mannosyltransferase
MKLINLIKSSADLKIFKFALVGALGTITNLAIFFLLVDKLKFDKTIISILVFIIAGAQNYILNHIWTFRQNTRGEKISLKGLLKFLGTALIGLAVNLLVLNLTVKFINLPYVAIAQGIGILAGMIFNYIGSKYFVFKKKKEKDAK